MIVLESILLWAVAACALAMIMHHVLKSPVSHERPELGLGKRFPVTVIRKRARGFKPNPAMKAQTGTSGLIATEHPQQTIVESKAEQNEPGSGQDETIQVRRKTKKSTDTMQFMLNKAMAERR